MTTKTSLFTEDSLLDDNFDPTQFPDELEASLAHLGTTPALRRVLDEALDSPRGIRIRFPSWNRAENFRNQLGKFRQVERDKTTKILSPGDPGYGVSVYDALSFNLESNIDLCELEVHWLWQDLLDSNSLPEILSNEARALLPLADFSSLSLDDIRLPPNQWSPMLRSLVSACSITLRNPAGRLLAIHSAPTFSIAFKALRSRIPAAVLIQNFYSKDSIRFETL